MNEKEYKDARSSMFACCSVAAIFAALLVVDLITGATAGAGVYIHLIGTVVWIPISVTQVLRYKAAAEKVGKWGKK